MTKRQYYEIQFSTYPDIVNLKQFREMLGGIGEGTALKLMQENRTPPTNRVKAAKYLPRTIPVMVTGAVKSICSVRIFLSSANSLIVKSGMRITNAMMR